MNESRAANARNAARFAATSVRFLRMAAGTRGASDRASIRTNAPSRTAAAANSASAEPETSPC